MATYQESINELERILKEMQSEQCDIDTLAQKTKRGIELLTQCRNKLTTTENELKDILAQLQG